MCENDPRCNGGDDLVGNALVQIAQGRWGVTGIFGSALEPPFAYTTGLTEFGHPELVITGIEPSPACHILNAAARELLDGADFSPGRRVPRVLREPHLPCVITALDTRELTVSRLLYGPDVPVLQLVWPDVAGCYPWDPGYAIRRDQQPLFGMPLLA